MRATHGSAFVLTCTGRAHHRVAQKIAFSADATLFMQQQVAPKLIKLLKSCVKNGPRDSICFSLPSDPGMLNAIAMRIGLTEPIRSSPSRGHAHVRVCFHSLILPRSNSVIAALLIYFSDCCCCVCQTMLIHTLAEQTKFLSLADFSTARNEMFGLQR